MGSKNFHHFNIFSFSHNPLLLLLKGKDFFFYKCYKMKIIQNAFLFFFVKKYGFIYIKGTPSTFFSYTQEIYIFSESITLLD